MKKIHNKIHSTLIFVNFFGLLGTIGASECNLISLKQFIVQGIIILFCFVLFIKLADIFYYNYTYRNACKLYNCKNRKEYLHKLAQEHEVDENIVVQFAYLLGKDEDFDALPIMIEDYLNMNIKTL